MSETSTSNGSNHATKKPVIDLSVHEAEAMIHHFTPGYRVVSSLGSGTYGQVFLAEDDLKKIAIKIVPLAYRKDGADGAPSEIKKSSSRDWFQVKDHWHGIHHPSLIRIRDYFRHETSDTTSQVAEFGLIYMDYWPWKLRTCISHLMEKNNYTPARKRALLFNLAQTLRRLKEETGMLVTDLKPDNILVRFCHFGPLSLGIIDLGGLHMDGAADFLRVDTTDAYLAPELALGISHLVDEPALIYSFGLIGFLILEGHRPFQDTAFSGSFHLAFRDRHEWDWSEDIRQNMPECVALVERCLREDPQDRFLTFAALAEAIQNERENAWDRLRSAERGLITMSLAKIRATPALGAVWREPVTGQEFIWIPPGSFSMGQSDAEKEVLIKTVGQEVYASWFARESSHHEVEVDGFWLGRYPVTRGQFRRFVEERLVMTEAQEVGFSVGPGKKGWGNQQYMSWLQPGFSQDDAHPVVCVNWFDAQRFASWLSWHMGISFTLPTETQWEYACRAGTETPFYFGSTIHTDQANYNGLDTVYDNGKTGEHRHGTTPVGIFPANAFGLYDMHGNVWEWCDDFCNEKIEEQTDGEPIKLPTRKRGVYRVKRGGAWSFGPIYLRSAYRGRNYPDISSADVGFRLVAKLSDAVDRIPT